MKKILFISLTILFCIVSCTSKTEKAATETKKEKALPAEKAKTILDYTGIETSHSGFVMKDGRKLYLARIENAAQLYLESADGKETKQLTFLSDAVDGYRVSPEESQLIFITSKVHRNHHILILPRKYHQQQSMF